MEGKSFPAFTLLDQTEKSWSKKDFEGIWTVLYAYPKDMTSGCTIEAHDFTKNLKKFQKLSAQVLGISPDDIKSHNKFCDKDGITFPLLSDPEKKLLSTLGIWIEKSMYGRKYMGVNRSTWIISPTGKIVKEWNKVKVPGHVDEVLETLKSSQ
ncbi:MAG: peroxiredoxin [Candidatus Gracilibacteria bacterium]|nr:peroxiredoxin [Candidatus Gracilibacteria bacterium]